MLFDADGSIADAAADSRRKHGAVDFLLSCCRDVSGGPFYGGLPEWWLSVPYDELVAQHRRMCELGRLDGVLPGVEGIAELCAASGARYFLPTANGFQGLGCPITDVGWGDGEPSEVEVLAGLREVLQDRQLDTEVVAWNCGDLCLVEDSAMRIVARGSESQ